LLGEARSSHTGKPSGRNGWGHAEGKGAHKEGGWRWDGVGTVQAYPTPVDGLALAPDGSFLCGLQTASLGLARLARLAAPVLLRHAFALLTLEALAQLQ